MTEYLVRYTYMNGVYETKIRTSSSGQALKLVEQIYLGASNISIVG